MKIRQMNTADLEQVMLIEKTSFPNPWSRNSFITELKSNPLAHYLVAQEGDKMLGYAGIWVIFTEAHIATVAVDPRYRRQGVATALISALFEEARCRGATKITLEVRPSNTGARRLYERFGFIVRGRRKNYYPGEDALIMWLENLDKSTSISK